MIDFADDTSVLLLNPRLPATERIRLVRIHRAAPDLPAHVWVTSSGSTGALKLVALSKRAILASARAVNDHLEAGESDVWCSPLPGFHVGGIGIHARAFLTGSRVAELETWNAREFARLVRAADVSLSALVPAQLADLTERHIESPPSMRAVVIGGGRTPDDLLSAARELGWPVLPSYGMTECCSQIATAPLESIGHVALSDLRALPHLEVRVEDGHLAVRGESLFTGYGVEEEGDQPRFIDPKNEGWFLTEDRVRLKVADGIVILEPGGRASEFFKIGGESVSLARLDEILAGVLARFPRADAAVFAVEDTRLGHVIHLAVNEQVRSQEILETFSRSVLPFERPRALHIAAIPRSALGKIRRSELAARIGPIPSS
ncbi:MAG: class I adenylate-forming enzyme family protein [Thermoanaerobaculia bacterium]